MATLEQALETASQLPPEQQEMLTDILRQRQNELWRLQTAQEAQESNAAFHEGKLSAESGEEVIARLRASLTAPEAQ